MYRFVDLLGIRRNGNGDEGWEFGCGLGIGLTLFS